MATGKTITATLNPQNQSLESVHHLVTGILTRLGCGGCGRMAMLKVHVMGDPDPEFAKQGVISFHAEGF